MWNEIVMFSCKFVFTLILYRKVSEIVPTNNTLEDDQVNKFDQY